MSCCWLHGDEATYPHVESVEEGPGPLAVIEEMKMGMPSPLLR